MSTWHHLAARAVYLLDTCTDADVVRTAKKLLSLAMWRIAILEAGR